MSLIETLAREGNKYNILANVIASPGAGFVALTKPAFSRNGILALNSDGIVPAVAALVHPSNTNATGSVFHGGEGTMCKLQWQRSNGALMRPDDSLSADAVLHNWDQIQDFSKDTQFPTGAASTIEKVEQASALPRKLPTEGSTSWAR